MNNKRIFSLSSILIISILSCTHIENESVKSNEAQEIDNLMKRYTENGNYNGTVLITKNGDIIYEKAFGFADREWETPNTIDTKFKIASISKQFTAFLIVMLAEEGYFDLNTPIINILPDYKGAGADKITLHHLLTHTSGIGGCSFGDEELTMEKLPRTTEDIEKIIKNSVLDFEPGNGYDYCNFCYTILAYIAEQVTGKTYGDLLNKKIFDPLKMFDTKEYINSDIEKKLARGYEYDLLKGFKNTSHLDNSFVMGAGGIISTAEDMLKWDSALYSNNLISEESLQKIFSPYKHEYGYGWEIKKKIVGKDTLDLIYHSGSVNGFMSMFIRIPQDNICIVFLQNSWTVTYYYDAGESWDYVDIGIPDCEMIALEQVIPILYGQKIEYPKKSIVQDMALLIRDRGCKAAIQKAKELKNDTLYMFDYIELAGLGEILNDWYQLPNESLQILEYAINEFPESFFVYEKYAEILRKNDKTELAEKYYNQAIEIFEQNPSINIKFKKKYELLKDKMGRINPAVWSLQTSSVQ